VAVTWPTDSTGQYYVFEGIVHIPINPETGTAVLLLRPQGGIGVGIPAIAKGDPGDPAEFVEGPIDFTELDYDDPTPAGFEIVEVEPGKYTLVGQLHSGAPGQDGSTSIDLSTISGTAAAGKIIVANSSVDGFEWAPNRIAARLVPASINNTSSGNQKSTVATISVAPNTFPFPWRPLVTGYQVVRGTGSDVRVDLIARLNGNTAFDGNTIARVTGIASTERLVFSSAPPAGSNDTYDKVDANAGATIYINCEQQSGSDSYTTSASEASFCVWVVPVA